MTTNPVSREPVSLKVSQILNLLLAEEYLLFATTRAFQSHAMVPELRRIRQLFEYQHGQIACWIDDIAEQARAVGIVIRRKWVDLTRLDHFSVDPHLSLQSTSMLSELLSRHREMIVCLIRDRNACARRLNDAGTAAFLAILIERHEAAAKELRVQLALEARASLADSHTSAALQSA